MSSDVITEPTWNRLHVARRVRDIAKSMIRLSMLGRSIFPILCLPDPGVEEPAIRLKVSEGPADVNRRPPPKPYPTLRWRARMSWFSKSEEGPAVSEEQVAAFRLARHHLATPAPKASIARVAGDMGGAQAQIMSAAGLSLRARVRGLRPEDVEKALWQDRALAKIWCMRGTVHLVPSDDLAVFARGSTGRVNRDTAWLEGHGYPAKMINRAMDALHPALNRPRTRKELADVIAKTLGVSAHRKSGRGWGSPTTAPGIMIDGKSLPLGYLVFLACYRGIACAGPPQGNEATFVRPDVWLRKWRDLPVEEAETELLRRYLGGYGPATVKDFFAWARMTLTAARAIWARPAGGLAPLRGGGETRRLLPKDLPPLRRA